MSLIPCRDCSSPRCEGCNTYTLSQMLHKGRFDCLMDGNRTIHDQEIAPMRRGLMEKES